MSTLTVRRLTATALARLIDDGGDGAVVAEAHRQSLAARFRAVATDDHRRLDAWSVEHAGRASRPFQWSPATTRRIVGNGALRRLTGAQVTSVRDGVDLEIDELLARAAAGRTRPGSLGSWLAARHPAELAIVRAAAEDWATTIAELTAAIGRDWRVATSDAYYDVERARTTLRARRDLVVGSDEVVLRVRGGDPGPSAGSGLRADLVAATFARADGRAPRRYLGLWPDAGLVLAVDGTMDDLRAGARTLVRTAVALRRRRFRLAA